METFVNEAKKIQPNNYHRFGFDRPSKYLLVWSRLFQSLVSQAGTYLLTKKFHGQHSYIFKFEGGCKIVGVNDLIIYDDHCRFDYPSGDSKEQKQITKLEALITKIVLEWNPNDPIESMIKSAAEFIKVQPEELKKALEENKGDDSNPFGGNYLNVFFRINAFQPIEVDRSYQKFCYIKYDNYTEEKIEEMWKKEDAATKGG